MKRPERPSGHAPSAPRAEQRAAKAAPSSQPRTAREPRLRGGISSAREVRVQPAEARKAERLKRRYEKAEVRRFTRASRRRRLGWTTALTTLAVIGILIAVAVFSPILALREIRVEGQVRLDPVVVADAVSGQLGTPLALLDDGRLRLELAEFTLIRSYVTEIVPPGTLVIHIVERTPLGVVATPTGFEVVDAAGVVLDSPAGRPAGLPLLQVGGGGIDGTGFAAMTQVLLALPPEVLAQVDSVTASTRDDVTLTLAGSSQRVLWGGPNDSTRKAAILAALLARFAGSGPGEYDVSSPGTAVFRAD